MKDETYLTIDAWLVRHLGPLLLIGFLMLASGPLLLLGQWVAWKLTGIWPDITLMELYKPILLSSQRAQRMVDRLMALPLAVYLLAGSAIFLTFGFVVLKAFEARVEAAKQAVRHAKSSKGIDS